MQTRRTVAYNDLTKQSKRNILDLVGLKKIVYNYMQTRNGVLLYGGSARLKKIAPIIIDTDTDLLWDLVSKGSKCQDGILGRKSF